MIPVNPPTISPPFGNYSHGISAGPLIVTSGQLGLAADGSIPDSVTAQAEICFAAIGAILAGASADFSHVVRVNAYVTQRPHMADYMAVRDRVFAHLAVKPASTLMIVTGFTRPEFLVEIEATAWRSASTAG